MAYDEAVPGSFQHRFYGSKGAIAWHVDDGPRMEHGQRAPASPRVFECQAQGAANSSPGATDTSTSPTGQPNAATAALAILNSARKRHVEQIITLLEDQRSHRRKKQRTVDDLEQYRKAARWLPRAIDPFLDIPLVFRVGIQAEIKAALALESEEDDDSGLGAMEKDAAVEALPQNKRDRYEKAYFTILDLVPGFRDTIDDLQVDPVRFNELVTMMNLVQRQSRSDDSSSLKGTHGLYYLVDLQDPSQPIQQLSLPTEKIQLGFNNEITGRHLCPARHRVEYDRDPIGTCAQLLAGPPTGLLATARAWPAFLFADPLSYKPGSQEGLLRGPLLPRVYRHIFTSPSSAFDAGARKAKGRASQAKIHNLTSVTPRTIAYAVVQARFLLNAQDEWEVLDGQFNAEDFYLRIVGLFESDPESEWAISTLKWWNLQVFKTSIPQSTSSPRPEQFDDEDDDFELLMAQRRLQVQARG